MLATRSPTVNIYRDVILYVSCGVIGVFSQPLLQKIKGWSGYENSFSSLVA